MKTPPIVRRFGGFFVSLIIATLVNLIAVPVVIAKLGAASWAELAVSQATAAIFGIFVAFGWGTVGAAMIASLDREKREQALLDSIVSRSYLFIMALPLIIGAALILSRNDPLSAVVASIAYLLPFLGAPWYFVGQARPWRLVLWDTLPQATGLIIGMVAIQFFPHMLVFAGTVLIFNLTTVFLSARIALSRSGQKLVVNLGFKSAMIRLKDQKNALIAAAAGTVNSNAPMIVVSILAPGSLPVYALADKLFRYAVAGFSPALQVVQTWIPEAGPNMHRTRVRVASLSSIGVGLVAGTLLAVAMPWLGPVFSGQKILIGYDISVPFGTIYGAVLVAQIVGLACLVPIGKGKALAVSSALGAIVNLPLMVILAMNSGGVGVAWSVGISEILVAAIQLLTIRRFLSAR